MTDAAMEPIMLDGFKRLIDVFRTLLAEMRMHRAKAHETPSPVMMREQRR